ncbi:MAG TPA: hypothetical protein V6D15_02810 [Oculatellaceae cyanobacterium]
MINLNQINQIISRIFQGIVEKSDIKILNQSLKNDEEISFQVGKNIINISNGKNIHIGDRIYYEWNEDAIKALIKAKSEDIVGMVLKPPMPSNYNEQTWVGRERVVSDLLPKLQGQTRLGKAKAYQVKQVRNVILNY